MESGVVSLSSEVAPFRGKWALVHQVKEGRDLPQCRARDPVYQLYVQPSNKSQGLF